MPPTHRLARSCAFDEAVRTRRRLSALEIPTTAMAARATMMQARLSTIDGVEATPVVEQYTVLCFFV